MITILFKPTFVRQLNKLESSLQAEVLEKINLFGDSANHKTLKVHKLHGEIGQFYSFSVNYQFRIVFQYLNKKEVVLMAMGDHDIYK